MIFQHNTAEINPTAQLGEGTKVWNQAQVREDVKIGKNCVISKNVYIDFQVVIGDNCKIQNNSSIFHGAELADGVFVGPHCALLNDPLPRAINADGSLKSADDWIVAGVKVGLGAALGGGTIVRPGVCIGEWALIGAGSVVTRDVPSYALVYGNPAKIMGFVDHYGNKMNVKSIGVEEIILQSKTGFEVSVLEKYCENFLDKVKNERTR
jgi:UDP-2-acetamido-3-amino-2,3-dideoxy-glucuronate N-acetyltransferase